MKGDVKAVRVTGTGSVFAGRTRLRGIILENDHATDTQSITLQSNSVTIFQTACPAGDVLLSTFQKMELFLKTDMTVSAIGANVEATILLDK